MSAKPARTTSNVLRAKIRKKKNRAARQAADTATAASLGITLNQLRAQRVEEAQAILATRRAEAVAAIERARQAPRSHHY
jgi:hypothetical protein